jgi:isopentenyl-diphosphate delta-isomerase
MNGTEEQQVRLSRKLEHVRHALSIGQSGRQGLADIKLVHSCLPSVRLDQIDIKTEIGELAMSSPIVVNAMTGGAEETEGINRNLAIAARESGLAMAVGSQMAALKDSAVASSYKVVRRMNPNGVVFANLGSEATLEQAKRAVEMLQANALQIHLNVMQELIMPEGDRDFRGAEERILNIVEGMDVPVIVKEVGFGMTQETAISLRRLGVRIIDVGGFGGTNFAAVENARRSSPLRELNNWGVPTSASLLEVLERCGDAHVIASGGIRTGLEAVKALALGASAVGVAGRFLQVLQAEGTAALIDLIQSMHDEMRVIMTAVGASSLSRLRQVPAVITGPTGEWCRLRGIDLERYARRGL